MIYRTGDLLFYRGRSLISRVIECVTRSRVSHVGIICAGGTVAEALEEGFIYHDLDRDIRNNPGRLYHASPPVKLSPRDTVAISTWVAKNIDSTYNYFGAIKAGLHDLDRNYHAKRKSRSLFCSQAAVRALQAAGLAEDLESADTTPGDLLTWCTAQKWEIRKL